ncbi:MAG: hypothetical protein EXQ90_05230 [Rhodospirillales bacterium]|nr:hypothetical protein [Rhodospirillales bacterium]
MIVRTARRFIQFFAALATGLAIVAILLAWRLSSGPISLGFLSPYVEEALSFDPGAYQVSFDDTILTWAGWERTLDIRAVNVRVLDPNGTVIADIPELSLALSAEALLKGVLAPRSIDLFRPSLRLRRGAEGRFDLGFAREALGSPRLISRIVDALESVDAEDPLGRYLTRLRIVDAELVVDDRQAGTTWEMPARRITLERGATGVAVEAVLDLEVDGETTPMRLGATYRSADRMIDVEIDTGPVRPASLARFSPDIARLADIETPLKISARGRVGLDGAIETARFEFSGGPGHVVLPSPMAQRLAIDKILLRGWFNGGPRILEIEELSLDFGPTGQFELSAPTAHVFPLRSVTMKGRYLASALRFDVQSLEADLQGPKVSVSGHIDGIGLTRQAMTVAASGTLRGVKMAEVKRYWPRTWGKDAWNWVTAHMADGSVREARADIVMRGEGAEWFKILSLTGDMVLDGFTVDALPPLPKARNVFGTATFDTRRFDIAITRGETGNLKTSRGRILFTGLDEKDQYTDLELFIDGPVRDALAFIDHPPLGFAKLGGLDPALASGRASARLKLYFIAEHTLTKDQVKAEASATLTDVSLIGAFRNLNLSGWRFDLDVSRTRLELKGRGQLGSIPATLVWTHYLDDAQPVSNHYRLAGTLDRRHRVEDLGLDFPPFSGDTIQGPISVEADYSIFRDGRRGLDARFDLAEASVSLPDFRWSKASGVAAEARLELGLKGETVVDVPRFTVEAPNLRIDGSAKFGGPDNRLEQVTLARFAIDPEERIDFAATFRPGTAGGWDADIQGRRFDLEPWLAGAVTAAEPVINPNEPPITVRYALGQVRLGHGRAVEVANGELMKIFGRWSRIGFTANLNPQASVEVRIEPAGPDKRRLTVRSQDAGETFRRFDYYDNMIGGTLELDGIFDDSKPHAPLAGMLNVDNFHIKDAPVLAHLLSLMGITGILEALQGEGLGFSRLEAPYTLDRGMITVGESRARGPVSFTAGGSINSIHKTLDLSGTVVPASFFNSLPTQIPIIGPLFGDKGSGVFVANFRMTGPTDKPEVTYNPLTLLTPGILRKIFDVFDLPGKVEEPASGGGG